MWTLQSSREMSYQKAIFAIKVLGVPNQPYHYPVAHISYGYEMKSQRRPVSRLSLSIAVAPDQIKNQDNLKLKDRGNMNCKSHSAVVHILAENGGGCDLSAHLIPSYWLSSEQSRDRYQEEELMVSCILYSSDYV